MHEIYLERSAERDLDKLERTDFDRIVAQMNACGESEAGRVQEDQRIHQRLAYPLRNLLYHLRN